MGAVNSDRKLKRSNESHQQFIKTLQYAVETLGGKECQETHKRTDDTEDVEEILFANKFQKLAVEKEGESGNEEDDEPCQVAAAARKVAGKAKAKKAKKTKKYKKPENINKQCLYREVAYEGLNSVAAGAVNNLTISIQNRTKPDASNIGDAV